MLYSSCSHMATVGVKGLGDVQCRCGRVVGVQRRQGVKTRSPNGRREIDNNLRKNLLIVDNNTTQRSSHRPTSPLMTDQRLPVSPACRDTHIQTLPQPRTHFNEV